MMTPFYRFWRWHKLRVWLCEIDISTCPSCILLINDLRAVGHAI